ncbi:MAG: hypothetical protein NT162_01315 [Candidatus Woesebacteria bacterium]|nr:hypothetical protein [Candidatus Woesebacteria bacterium]
MKKIFVIAGVFVVFATVIISPFLIKVRIDCKSQYGECPRQVLDKLYSFNGKSLFLAKRGINKILKSDFSVSEFSLQFKIPDVLHAELLVKKAVIAFKESTSGSLALVDAEGEVLSRAENSVLPVITVAEALAKVGQNIGSANFFALSLAQGVNQMYQINNFVIADGSLLVELPGQIRVLFPLEGDKDTLLGSLRLIYSKIQEDGNLAGYSQIDLRFKNPVLR